MHPQVRFSALALSLTLTIAYPVKQHRLSLADWGSYNYRDHKGPGTYAFGYDIEDPLTHNIQFRQEERHSNGSVTGSYGWAQPDGNVRIMHYIADHLGYRVTEERIPTQVQPPSPPQDDSPVFEGEFIPNFEVEDEVSNSISENLQHPRVPVSPNSPPVSQQETQNDYFGNDFGRVQYTKTRPLKKSRRVKRPILAGLAYQNSNGVNGGSIRFRIG